MAAKAAKHPEVLLSTLITDGDTSTSGLAYDGQNFFSRRTRRRVGHAEERPDRDRSPGGRRDHATAPTATEWANTLLQTIGYMYGWVDDQGDPINGDARNFVVMVGTARCTPGSCRRSA
jgi:hypothetical protein